MVKGTKIDKFFPRFEAIIKAAQQHNSESTGGTIHPHVVSSGLSYADILLAELVEGCDGMLEGWTCKEEFPHVAAVSTVRILFSPKIEICS